MINERIEFFDGYIKCNPYFLIIDIALIIHLLYSWYTNYLKTGTKITFWYLFMFKTFLINYLLLYPFNSSVKNFVSLDEFIFTADKFMDTAYLITTTGYISVLIGRYLFKLFPPHKNQKIRIIQTFEKFIEEDIKNSFSTNMLIVISLLLFAFMLTFTLNTPYLFNPRSYFLGNKTIRPVYNFLLAVYPLAVIFVGLRSIQYKKTIELIATFFLISLSLFLGTRTAAIEPILVLGFYYIYLNSKKISMLRIGLLILGLFVSAILLNNLRFSSNSFKFFDEILYGNHFSDTRDFAFLLSFFNDGWLEGKSYLAGLMTFIPRQYSEFRANWAFGLYCARLAQIYDPLFPGHRPGYFGEVFMNFGIIGVGFLGLWTGYIISLIDKKVHTTITNTGNIIKAYSFTFSAYFVSVINNSLLFAPFYTFITSILIITIIRHIVTYKSKIADE